MTYEVVQGVIQNQYNTEESNILHKQLVISLLQNIMEWQIWIQSIGICDNFTALHLIFHRTSEIII